MKNRNQKEISRMDNLALTAILDYWKDYDSMSVLLAYGELQRRDYDLGRYTNIMKHLKAELVAPKDTPEGDYFDQVRGLIAEYEKTKVKKTQRKEKEEKELKDNYRGINPSYIVSAGESLKRVVSVTIYMLVISLVSILITILAAPQAIQITSIGVSGLNLICSILILSFLYSAGKNLVKSAE